MRALKLQHTNSHRKLRNAFRAAAYIQEQEDLYESTCQLKDSLGCRIEASSSSLKTPKPCLQLRLLIVFPAQSEMSKCIQRERITMSWQLLYMIVIVLCVVYRAVVCCFNDDNDQQSATSSNHCGHSDAF